METTQVSEKLARRREQVRRAVRRWRKLHKDKYNAYTREYLKRPEAPCKTQAIPRQKAPREDPTGNANKSYPNR